MKLGLWFDYDHTYTFIKLYHALVRRMPNIEACGIVVGDRYFSHAKEALPRMRLISFYQLMEQAKDYVPSEADSREFKAFDDRHRLAHVAYSDRFVSSFTYAELVRTFTFLIRHFREYLRAERPDVLLFPCIASQFSLLFYLIAREEGVEIIVPNGVGVENLYVLASTPYFDYTEIRSIFEEMKVGRNPPNVDELNWANAFMQRIRAGDAPYPHLNQIIQDRKFQLPRIEEGLRYLKNYVIYYRNDFTLPTPFQRVRRLFWLRRNRRLVQRYFVSPENIEGSYILFPLHFEPEIATLILSRYDQRSFIDIIVRQLPLSCRLVVKEHPAMLGQRDWRFFDTLVKKYPNLLFVDPRASIAYLARRARAVVTLSGTVILEAMILGRPVIYTSRSRFGGFGLGHFTQDIINFGEAIEEAERKRASEEDVIRMLVAIRRKARHYVFGEPLSGAKTLDDDNIEKIADHVHEYLLNLLGATVLSMPHDLAKS